MELDGGAERLRFDAEEGIDAVIMEQKTGSSGTRWS